MRRNEIKINEGYNKKEQPLKLLLVKA